MKAFYARNCYMTKQFNILEEYLCAVLEHTFNFKIYEDYTSKFVLRLVLALKLAVLTFECGFFCDKTWQRDKSQNRF